MHERRPIDVGGAVSFTVAVTAVLIALTEVGNHHPTQLAAAVALACISAAIFVLLERRVSNPMVSFALWSHRSIAATNGVGVFASMTLIGLTTFLPIYVQIVMQRSPTTAGLALTTVLIGWPAGATLAARLFHRFPLRHLLLTGALLQPLGALFFVALTPLASPLMAAMGSLVMGFGMGLISVPSLVLIQEIVDSSQRGSVTASNIFSRNFGSTLGATVLGAVLNYGLSRSGTLAPVTSDQLRQLLNASGLTSGAAQVRLAMEQALNLAFWAMLVLSLGTVILALLVPSTSPTRRSSRWQNRSPDGSRLGVLFRGFARRCIAGVGHSFALRGTDGHLELRNELFTEGRWRGLARLWTAFLGSAVIRSL